jgi:transposase
LTAAGRSEGCTGSAAPARCFSKLKQFRAVATCYDKREWIYQGTVDVASIRIWLKDSVT